MLKQKARQDKMALSFFKGILTQSLCWIEVKVHQFFFSAFGFYFPALQQWRCHVFPYSASIFSLFCIAGAGNKRTAYSELDVTENTLFHCSSRNNSGKVPHYQECRW